MVALLCYIQAVVQYHFDVFGIVETATVVKNQNDSIFSGSEFISTYLQPMSQA